jgi:hypothetical protein
MVLATVFIAIMFAISSGALLLSWITPSKRMFWEKEMVDINKKVKRNRIFFMLLKVV